jgi:predicted ribonuclease YlaK
MKLPEDNLFFGLREKMTAEQEVYVDAIMNKQIIFCNSKAGTGKTTLAVACASYLTQLKESNIKGLLYVFNPTEEGKMGFRPGTQGTKEAEYLQPLKDALLAINQNPFQAIKPNEDIEAILAKMEKDLIDEYEQRDKKQKHPKKKLPQNTQKQWVEAKSHIFARGTNVYDMFVIIDEAQNWTKEELKKMLTRCHDSCIVVVIGHTGQIDLKDKSKSGFQAYIDHFTGQEKAAITTLTKNFRGWLATFADLIE